jgi:hypothetical protein
LRPRTLALWLSAGVPCIAYIVTASAYSYWLDSGEFVAAAVSLDIPHPPGQPLSALYGKLLSLLPLGSLSFRVALGQALASAAACLLCCRANAAALRGMHLDLHVTWALALLGAWLSAMTYGVWFQAVRPEVYALQTLCAALVYERLMLAATDKRARGRALLGAAFVLGLALCNHHLMAGLLLPAFLPGLWQAVRQRRFDWIAAALGLGALGLLVYLYLPLRAAAEPAMNFGDPSSWDRFVWVVAAQIYTPHVGTPVGSVGDRMLDVVSLWYEDLGFVPLVLACLGVYLGLRLAATRAALLVCLLVLLPNALVRAWMGGVRGNPDVLGYLGASYLALGTLVSCCLGAGAWSWRALHRRSWKSARRAVVLVPLLALALVPGTAARASLAAFTATDELDELRVRALPARAVVLESTPQTVFRSYELRAVEAARPDLVHVPLPFLRYPQKARQFLSLHPELTPVVASFQAQHDHFKEAPPLLALARTRPVFLELDTRVDPALYPLLPPCGVHACVEAGAADLEPFYAYLRARVPQQHEIETARQLLWVHYMNAVLFGALGQTAAARQALEHALAEQPGEQRLHALARALDRDAPLDVSAFLSF